MHIVHVSTPVALILAVLIFFVVCGVGLGLLNRRDHRTRAFQAAHEHNYANLARANILIWFDPKLNQQQDGTRGYTAQYIANQFEDIYADEIVAILQPLVDEGRLRIEQRDNQSPLYYYVPPTQE